MDQLLKQRSVASALAQVPWIVYAQVTEDYHLRDQDRVCAVVTVTNSPGESTEVFTIGDVRQASVTEPAMVCPRYIWIEARDQDWADHHVPKLTTGEYLEDLLADWVYSLNHWAERLDEPGELSELQQLQREELAGKKTLRDAIVRRVHVGKKVSDLLRHVAYEMNVNYFEVEKCLDETRHRAPQMVLLKVSDLINCPMPELVAYPARLSARARSKMTFAPQFSADGMWRMACDRDRTVLEAPTPQVLVARLEQDFRQTPRHQWLKGARIEAPQSWRWWV